MSADVLNSWKEIAAYLHRGTRTVQRWEYQLHLPVRRPSEMPRGSVKAFTSELDRWLHDAHALAVKVSAEVPDNGSQETFGKGAVRSVSEKLKQSRSRDLSPPNLDDFVLRLMRTCLTHAKSATAYAVARERSRQLRANAVEVRHRVKVSVQHARDLRIQAREARSILRAEVHRACQLRTNVGRSTAAIGEEVKI